MTPDRPRSEARAWENYLLVFSVMVVAICLGLLPSTPGPRHLETPEAIVPMAIAAGLGVFAIRLRRGSYAHDQRRRIARHGWVGALVAASISGWWVVLHLHTGVPVTGLTDQILTVVSGGLGAGVLAGRSAIAGQTPETTAGRDRVLAETTWADRSGPTPVVDATIALLAELNGVDRTELDPLYTHVDPELLTDLRQQDDSQWRYLFRTDSYEIGITSSGTVTAYEPLGDADVSTSLASG
ncbi:hypothetical protein SAMN05216559_1560 [Halomicrobium zhouii]|uniref:Halobacterial output domain-containing protein n=1 Tax=Halomicrobium zhouii TaxID=767519 RepID=A0A1I6KYQ4_9EURY|nr:HalOD1 output domain-containing protein [Halomicrobium zhouii]SFR96334.1 hypothetical protein SAMN05216559_1560 [Halomicrobium zhouii]